MQRTDVVLSGATESNRIQISKVTVTMYTFEKCRYIVVIQSVTMNDVNSLIPLEITEFITC